MNPPIPTWIALQERRETDGLTAEVVRNAALLLGRGDWQAYDTWRRALPPDQYRIEQNAQVALLSEIKTHLDVNDHHDHGSTSRHYIASRDVVVVGPTNADGVPVKCADPICVAWYGTIAEVGKDQP